MTIIPTDFVYSLLAGRQGEKGRDTELGLWSPSVPPFIFFVSSEKSVGG